MSQIYFSVVEGIICKEEEAPLILSSTSFFIKNDKLIYIFISDENDSENIRMLMAEKFDVFSIYCVDTLQEMNNILDDVCQPTIYENLDYFHPPQLLESSSLFLKEIKEKIFKNENIIKEIKFKIYKHRMITSPIFYSETNFVKNIDSELKTYDIIDGIIFSLVPEGIDTEDLINIISNNSHYIDAIIYTPDYKIILFDNTHLHPLYEKLLIEFCTFDIKKQEIRLDSESKHNSEDLYWARDFDHLSDQLIKKSFCFDLYYGNSKECIPNDITVEFDDSGSIIKTDGLYLLSDPTNFKNFYCIIVNIKNSINDLEEVKRNGMGIRCSIITEIFNIFIRKIDSFIVFDKKCGIIVHDEYLAIYICGIINNAAYKNNIKIKKLPAAMYFLSENLSSCVKKFHMVTFQSNPNKKWKVWRSSISVVVELMNASYKNEFYNSISKYIFLISKKEDITENDFRLYFLDTSIAFEVYFHVKMSNSI